MTERTPIEVTNLDRYGSPALPWSRPRDLLAARTPGPSATFFLGTVGPDGHPHAAGVGALWLDGDLYFVSGPGTRKSRNLAANPACTISVSLEGIDLILERNADHRSADAGGRGSSLPRGRLAGTGRGRCIHSPVQCPKRGSAALAPLP